MGLFHHALMAFLVILIPMVVVWPTKEGLPKMWWGKLFGIVMFVIAVWLWVPGAKNGAPSVLMSGGLWEKTAQFRNELNTKTAFSRSFYDVSLATDSTKNGVKSLLKVLGYYLFSPFPWNATTRADFLAVLENLIKAVLLITALFACSQNHDSRNLRILLFALFWFQALLWAVGSTNFGTGLRHQVVHTWLIFLLGGEGLGRVWRISEKAVRGSPRHLDLE
jgi:hypothetical protein